jgi:hypothetical protein
VLPREELVRVGRRGQWWISSYGIGVLDPGGPVPDQPRPQPRRIEFTNRHEFVLFDDRGITSDLGETYPNLESARSDLAFLGADGQLDPERTSRILWRPVPREWQVLPDELEPR